MNSRALAFLFILTLLTCLFIKGLVHTSLNLGKMFPAINSVGWPSVKAKLMKAEIRQTKTLVFGKNYVVKIKYAYKPEDLYFVGQRYRFGRKHETFKSMKKAQNFVERLRRKRDLRAYYYLENPEYSVIAAQSAYSVVAARIALLLYVLLFSMSAVVLNWELFGEYFRNYSRDLKLTPLKNTAVLLLTFLCAIAVLKVDIMTNFADESLYSWSLGLSTDLLLVVFLFPVFALFNSLFTDVIKKTGKVVRYVTIFLLAGLTYNIIGPLIDHHLNSRWFLLMCSRTGEIPGAIIYFAIIFSYIALSMRITSTKINRKPC